MEMLQYALTVSSTDEKGRTEQRVVQFASKPDILQKWAAENEIGGTVWVAKMMPIGKATVVFDYIEGLNGQSAPANSTGTTNESKPAEPEPKASPVRKRAAKKSGNSRGNRKS